MNSPFLLDPSKLYEEDKPLIDKQMEKLVSLGILTKNSRNHNLLVMLIARKLSKDKKACSGL